MTSVSAADVASLVKSCKAASEETAKVCDSAKNTDISAAKKSAGSLGQSLSSSSSNMGGSTACGQMQNVSTESAQALSKFKSACKPKWESCVSACSKAETALQMAGAAGAPLKSQFEAANKVCESAATEMASAESQMTSSQRQAQASAQCQQDLGGEGLQLPSFTPPTAEPETALPEVASDSIPMDCTNPAMQSSEACSPRGQLHQVVSKPGTNGTDGGSGISSGGMPDIYSNYQHSEKSAPSQQQSSLKSLGSSGGSGGSAGKASGFGKDDPIVSAIRGGSAGGMAGAKTAGSQSASGGGGGSVTSFNRVGGAQEAGGPRIPDLRKFLPNGQRAPADDSSGNMHGPHANMFRQVNQRYKQIFGDLQSP